MLTKQIIRLLLVFTFLFFIYRIILFNSFAIAPQQEIASTFLLGLRFDLRWIAIPLLILLLLSSFKILSPAYSEKAQKGWTFLFVFIALMEVLLFTIDFYYFDYLGQRLNMFLFSLMEDTKEAQGMVWASYPILKLLLMVIVIITIFYFLIRFSLRSKVIKTATKPTKKKRVISIIFMSLFLALLVFGEIGQYPLRWSKVYEGRNLFMAKIALNPFETLLNSKKNSEADYNIDHVKKGYNWIADYLGVKNKDKENLNFSRFIDSSPDRPVKDLNVVVIIAESFSAHLSSSFKTPMETTKYFDQLVPDGVLFDQCFTHSGTTAKGVFAILTGVPDFEDQTTASRKPELVEQHIVFNDLKDYQKYYFIGGSLSWANVRGFLNANLPGLKTYEELDFESPRADVWGVADRPLLMEANEILSKNKKPFFAVIQLASNHKPYTIPEEDINDEFQLKDLPNDTLYTYGFDNLEQFNGLRYMDYSIHSFMEAARKKDYFDNTLFVIIGDHGARTRRVPFFPKVWQDYLLDKRQTPLFFYSPKHLKPNRISTLAAQVDVGPTVMGILNKPYHYNAFGRNLLDTTLSNPEVYMYDDQTATILVDSIITSVSVVDPKHTSFENYSNKPISKPREKEITDSIKQPVLEYFNTVRYVIRNNKDANKN